MTKPKERKARESEVADYGGEVPQTRLLRIIRNCPVREAAAATVVPDTLNALREFLDVFAVCGIAPFKREMPERERRHVHQWRSRASGVEGDPDTIFSRAVSDFRF
jgi:hypothetical protein